MVYGLSFQPLSPTWPAHHYLLSPSPSAHPAPAPTPPLLTAHLGQLEEHGFKARVSPLRVGYQRDEQDILGGDEGHVVGGGVGATQPVGAKEAGVSEGKQKPHREGPRTPPLTLGPFTKGPPHT